MREELQALCLECGLCCNGALFADVRLEPPDDSQKLAALGLPIKSSPRGARFRQPCAALKGCECGIYKQRPDYCRKFECLLFKRVREGKITHANALATIRQARVKLARVERLLVKLGPDDKHLPLLRRFQRRVKDVESGGATSERAATFSKLTLAYHDLNLLFRDQFYP